jgi:hypothetical protein
MLGSNLEPRDYENHEIIELGAESVRTPTAFLVGPSYIYDGGRVLFLSRAIYVHLGLVEVEFVSTRMKLMQRAVHLAPTRRQSDTGRNMAMQVC